ncbi:MAG: CRISPR-associated endonuclease Cas1 [Lachnospiraceae bacterium]|nr:CRISPR-associated endonuclease Cas1 [Lachnospiraceae bacterium]
MEKIFSEEKLKVAVEKLLLKKDSCGIDGIYISKYKEYFEMNGKSIQKNLILGEYKPNAVQLVELLKKNGKKRKISKYTCTDRIILEVIKQELTPYWEGKSSKYSFAYQKNKGVQDAVRQCAKYIEAGNKWVVELDIKDFFDSINIERMLSMLQKIIDNELLLELIHKYLYIYIQDDTQKYRKTIGLIQGSPLSPLFSNIYMQEFDLYMERYHFCRFSDNINIYCNSIELAEKSMAEVQEYLKRELGLNCNKEKSGIYSALSRRFLGYEFYKNKNDNKVYIRPYKNENKAYYKKWNSSAIQKIDRNYHLVNDGILTKKDYTILFENNEGKYYLPVETCGSINVYSNVIFSSSFFEYAKKKGLNVNIFGKYGEYIGSFCTSTHRDASKIMLKQAQIYNDTMKRLEIAKKIELSSLHNQRENLRYYYRRKKNEKLKDAITYITNCMDLMKICEDINNLMLIEARAKQMYLHCFDSMIDDTEFVFEKRTRRPPKNEVNALISFGNVFLYQRIATEIRKTALDIRIGFVHSTNSRSETLNLDIAEIFKPIIVDRAVFTIIHNMQISKKEHFEIDENGAVFLNKIGKQIFIRELEKKLYQKVKLNGICRTYDAIIRNEVQKIVHVVKDGEKYKAYKYT